MTLVSSCKENSGGGAQAPGVKPPATGSQRATNHHIGDPQWT